MGGRQRRAGHRNRARGGGRDASARCRWTSSARTSRPVSGRSRAIGFRALAERTRASARLRSGGERKDRRRRQGADRRGPGPPREASRPRRRPASAADRDDPRADRLDAPPERCWRHTRGARDPPAPLRAAGRRLLDRGAAGAHRSFELYAAARARGEPRPARLVAREPGPDAGLRPADGAPAVARQRCRGLARHDLRRADRCPLRGGGGGAGDRQPRYFAEKHTLRSAALTAELYPGAREVFLVRDFRDMVSSILAFNRRRGVQGFGEGAADGAARLRRAARGWAEGLVRSYRRRRRAGARAPLRGPRARAGARRSGRCSSTSASTPAEAPSRACSMRSAPRCPSSPGTPPRAMPAASIGRWRTELDDELERACERSFGTALEAFGYER